MASSDTVNLRVFEVRCERCDVTFPIETRRCIHCGGPTGPGSIFSFSNTRFGMREGSDDASSYAGPLESAKQESPYESDEEVFVLRDGVDAEAAPTAGKSLLRSMGGLIWIVLLIGFSLARSCGGG